MTTTNQKLGRSRANAAPEPVDFKFLAVQTFDDPIFAREILELFIAQSQRIVPTLPALSRRAQTEMAHLLSGSARGVGAWPAAEAAASYEAADADERAGLFPLLRGAFAAAEATIGAHLAAAEA